MKFSARRIDEATTGMEAANAAVATYAKARLGLGKLRRYGTERAF